MLKNTFLHVPGLGIKTEGKIWSSGILCWADLLGRDLRYFPLKKWDFLKGYIQESLEHLSDGNPKFFGDRLPASQLWRLFPDFRDLIAYVDIETTGLECWDASITTIAVYDGKSIRTYVQGQNLDEFIKDVCRYKVLVTYNGKCFDVPFIETHFGIELDQVHIDLRYLLRSLGYSGGLKGCEKKAGIDRGCLDGLNGYSAVLLWNEYQKNKNKKALETLLAYNVEDVVNLEYLMTLAYNLKLKDTPFSTTLQLPFSPVPQISFESDMEVIEKIRSCGDFGFS